MIQTVLRKEIKYRVSYIEFARLEHIIEKELVRDTHWGDNGYWIRSLYFDSEYDEDLTDVLSGNYRKSKIRLRIYSPDTERVKLEFKCKQGAEQVKHSLDISREDAEGMIRGNYSFLLDIPQPIAQEIYLRMMLKGYRPRVMIEYHRQAYLYDVNDTRITYDTDIRTEYGIFDLFTPQRSSIMILPPDTGVLEIKYNHFLFSFIKDALAGIDALPVANSKYGIARLYI